MNAKQIIVLSLIVCLPMAMLAWLGLRVVRNEQKQVQQQFRDLLTGKLQDTDRVIAKYFERQQRDLLKQTALVSFQTADLREIVRNQPRISQLFVLDADGLLAHPPLSAPRNEMEDEFLRRAAPFLIDGDLIRASQMPDTALPADAQYASRSRGVASASTPRTYGWYVWYWGRGLHLIFWRRLESGEIIGIELDRARWMADLIAELPATAPLDKTPGPAPEEVSRIRLVDSGAKTVYQWGVFEIGEGTSAVAEIPLSAPLSAWRLQYFADPDQFVPVGRSGYFNLISAFAVGTLGLAALCVYFYRESSREMREANTRVNFVNQVSHELKTPLTNIRMYADLLQSDLELLPSADADRPRERLQVIVAESSRLSRLIGNVLSFARLQRERDEPQFQPAIVDNVLRTVIGRFRPALARQEIEVRLDLNAPATVSLDSDALEQILVNLLSNVEKYAAVGKLVEISSSQQADRSKIVIGDAGPGIARSNQQQVFEPFFRVANGLEDAAGTGIGLTIVRSLARRHGGDVRLIDSRRGAKFEIDLFTPQGAAGERP